MHSSIVGCVSTIIACLGFGSSYLPVKRVEVYDGQFFSLCVACGVLLVGAMHWACSGFYAFEPFACVGGAIWALGNLAVPFIVQTCGLGIGQLVWGCTNMLTGWAMGNFGLMGKQKDLVASPLLNYIGVALAMLSLGVLAFLKPEAQAQSALEERLLVPGARGLRYLEDGKQPLSPRQSNTAPAPALRSFAKTFPAGFIVALGAGVLFGANFNPPTYLQQQGLADVAAKLPARHSPNATDYVFSHFCGIFLTTAICFGLYFHLSAHPRIDRCIVLPGVCSGLMWGIAQVAWFQANSTLSFVVAFPIIVGVPGVIATLWGLALFNENSGLRNRSLIAFAIVVQGFAVLSIALSKDGI